MKVRISLLVILLAALSSAASADPSLKEMAARARDSLARDSTYEMISVRAFWGDATFLQSCAPKNAPTPAPFVIYFEVLPNGSLGSVLFEPLTETAKCIKRYTANRKFPKPPGNYVTKIEMSFE